MKILRKKYDPLHTGRRLLAWIFFICFSLPAFATEEPYVNELKGAQVAVGNFFTVSDEKFNNPVSWALIDQHISVDDIVSFEINFDTSIYFYNQPFLCTANFKIYIYGNQSDTSEITDSTTHSSVTLDIRYDTVTGKPYKGVALYKFKNAHKFRVKILSISSAQLSPIPAIFRVKGEIIINRQYTFNDNSTDVPQFSIVNGNQLKIQWIPSLFPGAEMFDLEYAFIDRNTQIAASIETYASGTHYDVPPDSLAKWFRNNSTRVTTAGASHIINATYDSGYILFRIRGVQIHYPDNVRWEGNWNYSAKEPGNGCTSSCPTGVAKIIGHEQNLNWQLTVSFAEEGKNKQVNTYFDGSLRNRQAVTIINTDNKSVVQETIYDALGRSVAAIMPAPTDDSTIHYFKGFNRNSGGSIPYSFADLLYDGCSTTADSISYTSGAGRYYSPANPFISSSYHAKYIPNAEGYPLAVTEYTADHTGRIKAQGGVGPTLQLGSGHEMKYFYGKPTQTELDRLFGSEAGVANHYLKNMVVDANGGITVNYLNAAGTKVATAFAGLTPPNLHSLPSNNEAASVRVSNDLINPSDFRINPTDYSLTASATFLAPVTGDYKFRYRVDPLQYAKLYGPAKDSSICSNCYYDLEVLFKNACDSLLARDTVSAGNIFDTACNPLPQPIIDSVTVDIQSIGEYYVTYNLRVSKDALNFYDSVHLVKNSDLHEINYFLLEELKNTDFTGCYNNCETCMDELGEKPAFIDRFKALYAADSLYFGLDDSIYVANLYDSLYANCVAIQEYCIEGNVCDQKLALLKLDVSPGGQYALYDDNYQFLEPEINVIVRARTELETLYDPNGMPYMVTLYSEAGDDSTTVEVLTLNDSTLIANWKDEWADALVQLHPEYCHYLWCLETSSSKQFDENVKNMEDEETAISNGWFNPQDYKALLDADPFFTSGHGVPFYNAMRDSLLYFSRTFVSFSQSDKNILQYIDVVLYCNNQYNGWDACNPDSNCRSRAREWFLYKTLYLNLKERFYEAARRASSNPTFANCVNCYIGSGEYGSECSKVEDFTTIIYGGPPAESGGCLGLTPRINYHGPNPHDKIVLNLSLYFSCRPDTVMNVVMPANINELKLDCLPEFQEIINLYCLDSFKINRVICTPLFVNTPPTAFVDSTCNYSCPDGIYADSSRQYISYYIQHGTVNTEPASVPPGFENCRFYPVFKLSTGAISSCLFTNVWVCTKDESPADSSCIIPCEDVPTSNYEVVATSPWDCTTCELDPPYYFVVMDYVPVPHNYILEIKVSHSGTSTTVNRIITQGSTYYLLDEIGLGYSAVVDSIRLLSVKCDSNTLVIPECPTFTNPPSACPDHPNADLYRTKIRRYPEYIDPSEMMSQLSSGNPQAASESSLEDIQEECRSNCEAQADLWIASLRRCTTDEGLLNTLKYYFIDICSKGCSIDRPFGTSSIPPEIEADYHSFKEAIIGVLGEEALSDSCTAELIASPYPYDKQPVVVDRLIMQSDYEICQKITQYKTAWQGSGFGGSFHKWLMNNYPNAYALDSLELDDLLNSCTNCNGILRNDIVLPLMFDPKSAPCISCSTAQSALVAFNDEFPAIDSTDEDYEILFANFFNHRLGYSLSFGEYRNFLDNCASPGYTLSLCNQPSTREDTTANPTNSCTDQLFATALTNATNTYIAYIDSVRRDFRNAWMTKCLSVQARLNMTADLYEYHYTLYYYDLIDNLVKTIPPAGVDLLDAEEIADVEYFRLLKSEGCYQYSDSVKLNNNGQVTWATTAFEWQPYTMEGNINLSSDADQVIMSKLQEYEFADTSLNPYYVQSGFMLSIRDNKLEFSQYNPGISYDPVTFNPVQNKYTAVSIANISSLMPVDKWTHFAIRYTGDSLDLVHIYINGQEIAMQVVTNEMGSFYYYPTEGSFVLGAQLSPNFPVTGKLRGSVKNLRIYNRLLPVDEIRQNAFNLCQQASNQSGMIFWAVLNDATDNLVSEMLSQQNGALTGFSWLAALGTYPEHRLPTVYQYNSLNQVVRQYSPDGDTSEFFYDRLGRLTASQNIEQKENPSYSGTNNRVGYTKYDELGRIIEIGEKSGAVEDIHEVNLLDTTAIKSWIVSGTDRQVTKTIYDDPVNIALQTNSASRKRITAAIYLEQSNDIVGDSTIYEYDISGNVKTVLQHIKNLVAVDPVNGRKEIKYEYDLVSGKVNRIKYQNGKGDQFYYRYDYDGENRVIRTLTSRDNLIWTQDASDIYYLHGALARTELGQFKVQGVDYAHTLQGWIKGVNSDSLGFDYDISNDGKGSTLFSRVSRDVFGYKLGYFDKDYTPIGGVGATAFVNKLYTASGSLSNSGNELYNANISHLILAISKIGNDATTGYTYGYDQLNRMIAMRQHVTNGNGGWNNSNIGTAYNETISYDPNGNILQYLRKGYSGLLEMDSLNYKYNRDISGNLINNRLNHIRDAVSAGNYTVDIDNQSPNNYLYDRSGNVVRDVSENIDTITWTTYGKINRIVKSGGATVIDFGYDAGGNRTFKKINVNDTITQTYYVRDAQGNVLGLYSIIDGNDLHWNEQYLYGASRLGSWRWDTIIPSAPPIVGENNSLTDSVYLGSRVYELGNHLENILVTVSDKKVGFDQDSDGVIDYYVADVISAQDYYSFGLEMPNRIYNYNYAYSFNGKRDDKDANSGYQDYGMREYDKKSGRFISVDPIAKKYPELTPYQFASNRPIDGVDLDGLEYMGKVKKFEYDGSWTDYVSAIDNGVINIINIVPDLWNSGVANYQSLRRGTWTKDITNEVKQIGNGIKDYAINSWSYTVNTPFQQQLVDTWNTIKDPNTLEQITTIFLGSKLPTGGKGNLLKVETSVARIAEVNITTTKNLFGGNSIRIAETRTTTVIGRYTGGVEHVKATGQFRTGVNNGGINILNVKNWSWEVNAKWLRDAIKRNDVIRVVSDPRKLENIWENGKVGGTRTTFGREVQILEDAGYKFDGTNQFIKPKK